MLTLGEDINKPNGEGLKPFTPPVPPPKIVPEVRQEAPKIVVAPHGYYVIAYKLTKEKNGKNRFAVTDHTNIEKFITERLRFGEDTHDIKIIEKVDDYLDALSIATILTLEENFEGGIKKFRLGGILQAKYTLKEIFNKNTKLKRFDV